MAREFRESCVIIANPILGYWRSWKFKLETHLKVYKDAQVNEFFWSACLLGGFLKTKKISKTFKKILLIWNISTIIIMIGLNIACLVWYEEKNRTTYRKLSKPILSLMSVCSGQALCYLNSDLIEKYADNMDKRIETESMSFDEDASRFNGKMSKIEIFVSCTPSIFFIIGLSSRYFLPNFGIVSEIFSSHYPFNKNFQTYPTIALVTISFIQFLTTLKISTGAYCLLKLMKLYITMMRRTFGCYLKRVANTGLWTSQQMENNHNEELLVEQNESHERSRSAEEFAKQRNAVEDNFEKEMGYFSKQLWSLLRIHQNLRKLFENGCTILLLALYAISLPLAGRLLWVIHHPSDISASVLNATIYLILNVYLFYKFCWVGTQISEILGQFPIEVYSTPWYTMSKKTRRTICLMLAQTQYEQRIRVFNTTPIDVCLFYQFVDSLYSNGSVVHSNLERPK